ncbi:hypothetical protein BH11PAT3_BH11PAT3_0790 [soil metagenome]
MKLEAIQLLKKLLPDLLELNYHLVSIGLILNNSKKSATKIGLTVDFFSTVAPWYDRTLDDLVSAFALAGDVPQAVKDLSLHFRRAGRSQYGYNQTGTGETVTANNVWLGDRMGLWTKPVSYWLTREEDKSEVCRASNGQPMTVCDVIGWQAVDFMDSHVGPMIDLITDLEDMVHQEKQTA